MAGLKICRNLVSISKDEFAEKTSTKGSSTLTSISAVSHTQTPAPAQTLTPNLSPPGLYTNMNLQTATKLAFQLFVKSQEKN